MRGLIWLGVLALATYMLFVEWSAPPYLTGGLLLIAAYVFGKKIIINTPVYSVERSVLFAERHYGLVVALTLLLVGLSLWSVYGGGQ